MKYGLSLINIFGNGGLAREISLYAETTHPGREIQLIPKDSEEEFFSVYSGRGTTYFIGIGDPKIKKRIWDKCKKHQIISSSREPINYPKAQFCYEQGVILAPNVFPTCGVAIGTHTMINIGVSIGHEAKIGSCCQVNPLTAISGGVVIGNGVLIGTGAIILENISIGSNSIVGAGAVVTKDIPDNEIWVGCPAKKLKDNEA